MANARYRLIGSLFNYLAMALVMIGSVGYLIHWQSREQAQYWLLGAFVALFVAAISFRAVRAQGISDASRTKGFMGELEPLWPYYFIACCIIVSAIDSFTSLLNSRAAQIIIAGVFVLGLAKVVFDSWKWRRRTEQRLDNSQRLVFLIAMIPLFIEVYRFVSVVFFKG